MGSCCGAGKRREEEERVGSETWEVKVERRWIVGVVVHQLVTLLRALDQLAYHVLDRVGDVTRSILFWHGRWDVEHGRGGERLFWCGCSCGSVVGG
jgi:hypothetical protein